MYFDNKMRLKQGLSYLSVKRIDFVMVMVGAVALARHI